MASYTSRQYQIEQIVTRALHYADVEESNYKRYLQFAFDGIRELSRGIMKNTITYSKQVPDSINRVNFPQDMEELIGVGVPHGGRLWLLTERDEIIATYTEDDEGNLSLDSNDGEGVNLITNQFENFRSIGGINVYGYYKVDWKNEEIIINSNTRGEVLLVYTTSGIYTDQIQYVDAKAADALIAYILWRDALGKMKSPKEISVVQMREREWIKESKKLKKRDMFSIRQFRDHWNRTKSLLRR